MKCVGIQYIETIRRYLKDKLVFDRTIHMSFVPGKYFFFIFLILIEILIFHWNLVIDEETGGKLGMEKFVNTPEFAALNVGFALDEGLASNDNNFSIFYGERTIWRK